MVETEYQFDQPSPEEDLGMTIFSPLPRRKAVAVAVHAIRIGVNVTSRKVPDKDDPYGRSQITLMGPEKLREEISRRARLPHPSPVSPKNG